MNVPDRERYYYQYALGLSTSDLRVNKATNAVPLSYDNYTDCSECAAGERKQCPLLRTNASYWVAVTTGDLQGAGTDANVYLTIHGKRKSIYDIHLNPHFPGNAFERGETDTTGFNIDEISGPNVGDLVSVELWQDGSFAGSTWYPERVIVERRYPEWTHVHGEPHESYTLKERKTFVCRTWLEAAGQRVTCRPQ